MPVQGELQKTCKKCNKFVQNFFNTLICKQQIKERISNFNLDEFQFPLEKFPSTIHNFECMHLLFFNNHMSKFSFENKLWVLQFMTEVLCVHIKLDRQNIFLNVYNILGLEKDAAVRPCQRRRKGLPEMKHQGNFRDEAEDRDKD